MKNKLLCIILLSGPLLSKAQTLTPEVFASAGDYFLSANNSVAWTIGEPFSESYTSANNFLTQGFHQPQAAGVISVAEQPGSNSIIAYPNPTVNNLNIYFGKIEGAFLVSIFDFSGKLVYTENIVVKQLPGKVCNISFSKYSAGPYHLQLLNKLDQSKKSYTIIKQK